MKTYMVGEAVRKELMGIAPTKGCIISQSSLLQELASRDLTINAIAKDLATGEIVDPFNGRADIENKVLRHVSEPIKVMSIVKPMCEYGSDWTIAANTKSLVRDMKNLTTDWGDLQQCLGSDHPQLLIPMLSIFPEIDDMIGCPQPKEHHPEGCVGKHTMLTMKYARKRFPNQPKVIFAALCHDFGKPPNLAERGNFHGHGQRGVEVIDNFCARWKVPNEYRDLAIMTSRHHTKIHSLLGRGDSKPITPKSIMKLFILTNALVNPIRFADMIKVCEADANGRGFKAEYPQAAYILKILDAVLEMDSGSVTRLAIAYGRTGPEIGEELRLARIACIRKTMKSFA